MADEELRVEPPATNTPPRSVGFLISQLGFFSSKRFMEALEPVGIDPREFLLMRFVAAADGRPQHELAERLAIPPSRMVALVDALEQRGLLRRRPDPGDRRVRTLHLTRDGRRLLDKVMEISLEHERQLCKGLQPAEREQLITLLSRLAAEQGLGEGVHPGAADPEEPKEPT